MSSTNLSSYFSTLYFTDHRRTDMSSSIGDPIQKSAIYHTKAHYVVLLVQQTSASQTGRRCFAFRRMEYCDCGVHVHDALLALFIILMYSPQNGGENGGPLPSHQPCKLLPS